MSARGWRHTLSFAIRFNDHFTGRAIDDELPVRVDRSFARPVLSPDGGRRQSDGSYRFIDLGAGTHRVRWLPPLKASCLGWVSWDDDPLVQVPAADPTTLISRDLWPAPTATLAPGITAVRGRLSGAGNAGLRVSIANPAFASTRFTRSDAAGDFLFPLPEPMETDPAGRLPLVIDVAEGARAVSGGEFVPADGGTAFAGAGFAVSPGRVSRVLFRLT